MLRDPTQRISRPFIISSWIMCPIFFKKIWVLQSTFKRFEINNIEILLL